MNYDINNVHQRGIADPIHRNLLSGLTICSAKFLMLVIAKCDVWTSTDFGRHA